MLPLPGNYASFRRVALLASSDGASTEVIAGGCGFERLVILRRFRGEPSAAWVEQARRLACSRVVGLAELHDIGCDAQGGFVARSYVPGVSLAALAAGRARPSGRAFAAALDRAAAIVRALHRAGLAHGALHLRNVIVGQEGRPILTDAGFSRATAGGGRCDEEADLASLAALRGGLAGESDGGGTAGEAELAALVAASPDPRASGRSRRRPPR